MRHVQTPVKELARKVLKALENKDFAQTYRLFEQFWNGQFRFPRFRQRIEPYKAVVIQLLKAIELKHQLLLDPYLRQNKKEMLKSAISQHMDELHAIFKKWDEIYLTYELEDYKSTALIVKSVFWVVVFWTVLALIKDYHLGPLGWWYWISELVR